MKSNCKCEHWQICPTCKPDMFDEKGDIKSNVTHAPFKRNHLVNMVKEMLDVIYSYADRVSLAEAVGSLELCKAQLLEEQHK